MGGNSALLPLAGTMPAGTTRSWWGLPSDEPEHWDHNTG